MHDKAFARTGLQLPVIGQGTWNMPERGSARKRAIEAIRLGISLGLRHIDTAEMYGAGAAEELTGDAIEGLPREELFIASKVLPSNATFDETLRAAERSIARMRCEYMDLYMLHWPGEHPLRDTMRALETLVTRGLTRYIGVSNFDAAAMREAASYLRDVPLSSNQVLYHLGERGIEHELIEAAARDGIAIVAYTPFGRGAYTRNAKSLATLERIATKHGATVRQIVLAFLTRWPNVFAIAKAATTEHVKENAGAGDVHLDKDDIATIDAAYPIGPTRELATL
jgi:diketogulonate reductase-like aldo/keto reductase